MRNNIPFYKDGREEFKFLETEFNFRPVDIEGHWSSYDINYQRDNLLVKISFEFYDGTFSIHLIRADIKEKENKSLAELLNPNDKHKFNLTLLLSEELKEFDNSKLYPKSDTNCSEAMKYQAEILKKYGREYLTGEKWPVFPDRSNQEIDFEIFRKDGENIKKASTEKIKTIDQLKNFLKRKRK